MEFDVKQKIIVSRWSKRELFGDDIISFKKALIERWTKNAPLIQPPGFRSLGPTDPWDECLQLYILAAQDDTLPATDNLIQIVAHLIEAFRELKPTLNLGTLWAKDVIALRRFKEGGACCSDVDEAISDCLRTIASTKPALTPSSLSAYADISNLAALALVGETATRELVDAKFAAGQSIFEWRTYSRFRVSGRDSRKKLLRRLNKIETLSRYFFTEMVNLYGWHLGDDRRSDQTNNAKHRLGDYHKLFDQQFILFAEANPNELEAPEIISLLINLREADSGFDRPWVWEPSFGRVGSELKGLWRPQPPIEYEDDYESVAEYLNSIGSDEGIIA